MANLSQIKRQRMIDFLETLKKEHTDDESIRAFTEIENQLRDKKYGLVWERHEEAVDVLMRDNIPVFTEVPEREITAADGFGYNFILEGDNLQSLYLLKKTHREKIDMIYIDPPYNTGGTDFRYDDAIVSKEDGYRHSKWLSFMSERLEIAKDLLCDTGLIFISIDDHEIAALTLLCDEIFGEENHIETIIWKNKYGAGAKTVGFIGVHEYILCYGKGTISDIASELDEDGQSAYKKKDEKFDERGGYLTQPLMTTSLADRPNLMYPIEYNGDTIYPRKQWVWSKDRLENAIENNEVEFNKKKDGTYSVRAKKYLIDENGDMRRGKPLSIMNGPFTQEGTREIRELFGSENIFKFSKPSELIRYFIAFAINGKIKKDAIILDFFAGSGTTAQAVLEQNKRDGGNRRFILCTNNENNICEEVTYERVKRVITGYDSTVGIPANVKYFKCDWTPRKPEDYLLSNALCLHIKEMIELQNGIEVDNVRNVLILNKADFRKYVVDDTIYGQIENVWVNQNIIFNSEEMERLNALGFKYIPREFFGQELKEAAE